MPSRRTLALLIFAMTSLFSTMNTPPAPWSDRDVSRASFAGGLGPRCPQSHRSPLRTGEPVEHPFRLGHHSFHDDASRHDVVDQANALTHQPRHLFPVGL